MITTPCGPDLIWECPHRRVTGSQRDPITKVALKRQVGEFEKKIKCKPYRKDPTFMKLFILSRILVWNRYCNITIDIELSEVKKEETITPWQKKRQVQFSEC